MSYLEKVLLITAFIFLTFCYGTDYEDNGEGDKLNTSLINKFDDSDNINYDSSRQEMREAPQIPSSRSIDDAKEIMRQKLKMTQKMFLLKDYKHTQCKCTGAIYDDEEEDYAGGPDCNSKIKGKPWCYVEPGKCEDDKEKIGMSYQACANMKRKEHMYEFCNSCLLPYKAKRVFNLDAFENQHPADLVKSDSAPNFDHEETQVLEEEETEAIVYTGPKDNFVCYECLRKYYVRDSPEVQKLLVYSKSLKKYWKMDELLEGDERHINHSIVWIALANAMMIPICNVDYQNSDPWIDVVEKQLYMLKPYFFGYITLSSIGYFFWAYWKRIKNKEFTLGMNPLKAKGPFFQFLAALTFVIVRLTPSTTDDFSICPYALDANIIVYFLYWFPFWHSAMIYEPDFLVFNEIYPHKWLFTPTAEFYTAAISKKSTPDSAFYSVVDRLKKPIFYFCSIASYGAFIHLNYPGEFQNSSFQISTNPLIRNALVYGNLAVWTATIFYYFGMLFVNVRKKVGLSFNNFSLIAVMIAFTQICSITETEKVALPLITMMAGGIAFLLVNLLRNLREHFAEHPCNCCKSRKKKENDTDSEISFCELKEEEASQHMYEVLNPDEEKSAKLD